jgi:GTP-binding protein
MSAPSPPTVIEAAFVGEARDVAHLPPAGPPEIAIAGRSNVGKSTLLNRMAGRHSLARVSKTPGRTRGLVLFDLEIRWPESMVAGGDGNPPRVPISDRQRLRLVDLPGYGFAKVSHDERHAWQVLVEGYVGQRDTLMLVLLLVDARRELGAEEEQLMAWLEANQVPCLLVVTKADKLGASERGSLREHLRKQAAATGASVTLVSGATGEGVDGLWRRIAHEIGDGKDDDAGASG